MGKAWTLPRPPPCWGQLTPPGEGRADSLHPRVSLLLLLHQDASVCVFQGLPNPSTSDGQFSILSLLLEMVPLQAAADVFLGQACVNFC